ncbi:hypothetical protein MGL_2881 [Malassezia globosa CBS 7966]|uniref:Plasma membrane fusion protein PRM1 n=1 Tax=Malassezia globosa (strain ATCC MYA-4612 / CBS 7966) TaxID=425265 RepID=A8Q685_MALGO|nr:uncharacterized protein MGL_2881 [Malassezia globosa CBS 7966]EDP42681.1 hypothetical protein MGL_2881 [Malassezia globosa CBS 7966]
MIRILVQVVLSSYKSLLLCVIQFVVQGVLSVLDAATHAVSHAVHDAAQFLRAILDTLFQAADGVADIMTDTINGILGLFGQQKIPTHSWSEPAALRYVTLRARS